MEHVAIRVCVIHPNPHRDFTRNPIREDQVEKIIESIGRTGFWDNVVVREHPERPGEYQLAYGHSRLEAVKQAGITEVVLPVAPMSDWDMYCAMVDENETQQQITPAIAFENIETGVAMLEKAFVEIGEKGGIEAFNKALGRVVLRNTTRANDGYGFEQARNAFFRGEGIGRRFVTIVLPSGKVHEHVIQEVLNTHYAEQREEAKKKQAEEESRKAEAKKKQAEAKKKQAEEESRKAEAKKKQAEEDSRKAEAKKKQADEEQDQAEAERKWAEAEAERIEARRKEKEATRQQNEAAKTAEKARKLQEESNEATRKADKLKAEAKRIGEGSIKADILLKFETPTQMTAFADAVKASCIPKAHHHAAMEHAIEEDFSVRQMSEKLNIWWYEKSGNREKDNRRREREEALKKFKRRYSEGDYSQYFMKLGDDIRRLTSDIKVGIPAARYYDNSKLRVARIRDLEALIAQATEMIVNLRDDGDANAIDVEWRKAETKALSGIGANGAAGTHADIREE